MSSKGPRRGGGSSAKGCTVLNPEPCPQTKRSKEATGEGEAGDPNPVARSTRARKA